MTYDYSDVELELRRLISASYINLVESEAGEVIKFIDVDEYGLALETLCFIIIEEDIRISQDVYNRLFALSEAMKMDIQDTLSEVVKQVER